MCVCLQPAVPDDYWDASLNSALWPAPRVRRVNHVRWVSTTSTLTTAKSQNRNKSLTLQSCLQDESPDGPCDFRFLKAVPSEAHARGVLETPSTERPALTQRSEAGGLQS